MDELATPDLVVPGDDGSDFVENFGIAAVHGVDAFVLISTDKAINPTSVMGATKRLAEIQLMAIAASAEPATTGGRMTAEGCQSAKTKFMAVRFGNVFAPRAVWCRYSGNRSRPSGR